MKIKFDGVMSNNATRAMLVGSTLGTGFICCSFQIEYSLDDSHEALLQSSMSNVTSIQSGSHCGIPYDNCLCSVQSTQNLSLKYCLTDNFLLGSRLFPLVSFILQICLIRDLFTFSGKYSRFVVYGLWSTAVYIFVIIANGIYRSSCFHRQMNKVLCCTGGVLFLPVVFGILRYNDSVRSRSNDHRTLDYHDITDDESSEDITDESIDWKDLL